MGLGVSLTLGTGLAAVGFTGFLAFSAMLSSSDAAWSHPVPLAGSAGAGHGGGDERPQTASARGDMLGDNPLYRIGELGEVTCEAPDLDPEDPESVEAFVHEIADCLDRAWGSYFASAGMEFTSPNRVYWYSAGTSPCGAFPTQGTAAFYCQANQGLYLGVEDIVAASAGSDRPEAYTFLLSHEYGHHVQGQSRILAEFHEARAGVDQETADELTRRNELQANCLGGVFLGASGSGLGYGGSERENILDDVGLRSDRGGGHTHGSARNGRLWTAHGMDRVDPGACNTWNAPEDLVE
ncbi:neutral zinc metallopeptidase [Nocardiopsis sp. CT-R113]|uniref:Neutral zinc metallopeptidase n=1 Tax=Nocardiopsis codii TaxID=3065942 RepID=A0ABU7KAU8_9ACTN|nr:neutral zinc metallopeptidase [Nocardiopsis sp. CT-R113]MEE2039361.1 neutral zinc metallopeptidase [Nocardiopsis sp. CT-R113]